MPPSALALSRLAYACALHNRASPGLIYLPHAADLGVFGRARIAVLIGSGTTNIRCMECGVPAPLRVCFGRIDTVRRLAEGPQIQISSIAFYEVDDALARPAPEATPRRGPGSRRSRLDELSREWDTSCLGRNRSGFGFAIGVAN